MLVMEHDGRRVIDLLDKVERGRGPIVIKPRSSFCKSLLKSLGAK
jgi:stalled ribosome rescue protein Dom34